VKSRPQVASRACPRARLPLGQGSPLVGWSPWAPRLEDTRPSSRCAIGRACHPGSKVEVFIDAEPARGCSCRCSVRCLWHGRERSAAGLLVIRPERPNSDVRVWDPSSSSGRNADALAHRPPSQGSRSRQITYSCQPSASRAHTCSRAPSVHFTVMLKLHSRRRVQVARDRLAAHPCESVSGGEGVDVAGGEVGAVADQP
jgi:hypothetical protein